MAGARCCQLQLLSLSGQELRVSAGRPALLEQLVALEQRCVVPPAALLEDRPAKGLTFVHTAAELEAVLAVPGAEVLCLQDAGARIWGVYIFHLGPEFAAEDLEWLSAARRVGGALLPPERPLAVAHYVCIDEAIERPAANGGLGLKRGPLYLLMHVLFVTRLRECGINQAAAFCRVKPACNPVMVHGHRILGWAPILPGAPAVVQKTVQLPQRSAPLVILSTVGVLDPASPWQDRLRARARSESSRLAYPVQLSAQLLKRLLPYTE